MKLEIERKFLVKSLPTKKVDDVFKIEQFYLKNSEGIWERARTYHSSTDNGIALVKYLAGDDSLLKEMLSYSWVKTCNITTTKQLFEKFKLKDNFNSLIESGKNAIFNLENFGYTDWYSWSCDNWGTKWNASSSYLHDNNILEFETAWSNPYPVLLELSGKFTDIKFIVEYADEDIGSNCGRYVLQGGTQIEFVEYDAVLS